MRPHAESFGSDLGALAWNGVSNGIAAIACFILFILIYKCQRRYPSVVFGWVRPLTLAFEAYAIVSVIRLLTNVVVLFTPAYVFQNIIMVLNFISLVVAAGYASVYYRRIPVYLMRMKKHQADSRRFKNIADAATDAFVEIDAISNIWYANVAAARIFGYTNLEGEPDPTLLLGNSITELMPPEFRERHLQGIARYLGNGESHLIGKPEPTALAAVRRNGEKFPIELTLSVYELNETVRFIAIIRDISYRVALETTVQEAGLETPERVAIT